MWKRVRRRTTTLQKRSLTYNPDIHWHRVSELRIETRMVNIVSDEACAETRSNKMGTVGDWGKTISNLHGQPKFDRTKNKTPSLSVVGITKKGTTLADQSTTFTPLSSNSLASSTNEGTATLQIVAFVRTHKPMLQVPLELQTVEFSGSKPLRRRCQHECMWGRWRADQNQGT